MWPWVCFRDKRSGSVLYLLSLILAMTFAQLLSLQKAYLAVDDSDFILEKSKHMKNNGFKGEIMAILSVEALQLANLLIQENNESISLHKEA